jgi:hypothetical protein
MREKTISNRSRAEDWGILFWFCKSDTWTRLKCTRSWWNHGRSVIIPFGGRESSPLDLLFSTDTEVTSASLHSFPLGPVSSAEISGETDRRVASFGPDPEALEGLKDSISEEIFAGMSVLYTNLHDELSEQCE